MGRGERRICKPPGNTFPTADSLSAHSSAHVHWCFVESIMNGPFFEAVLCSSSKGQGSTKRQLFSLGLYTCASHQLSCWKKWHPFCSNTIERGKLCLVQDAATFQYFFINRTPNSTNWGQMQNNGCFRIKEQGIMDQGFVFCTRLALAILSHKNLLLSHPPISFLSGWISAAWFMLLLLLKYLGIRNCYIPRVGPALSSPDPIYAHCVHICVTLHQLSSDSFCFLD